MKSLNLGIENRVQAWAVMGPVMLLAASVVCLVKAHSFDWMVPTMAGFGIAACWRWRMSGLVGTLAALFLYVVITYGSIPVADRFWHVGTTMAATLALIITTLSFEEVENIVGKVLAESQSRLANICRVDEKLKSSTLAWQKERTALLEQLRELSEQLQEKETRVATFDRLMGVVRQDLESAQTEHERILGELFEQRQKVAHLTQDLALGGEGLVSPEADRLFRVEQGRLKQLRAQFNEKDQSLHEARQELFATQEKLQELELVQREKLEYENSPLYDYLAHTEKRASRQEQEIKQLEELVKVLVHEASS